MIRQAVKDYVSVLVRLFSSPAGKKKTVLEMEKAELEVFFHSEWFHILTDMDGEQLLISARRLAMEKAREAIRRKHRKSWRKWKRLAQRLCAADAYLCAVSGKRKGNDDEDRKKFAGGSGGAEPAEPGKEGLYRICTGAPTV